MADLFIGGVPFIALGHRDARFVRAPGLFAFARRARGGRFTVLHFEMTEAINRVAGPGHARWDWCAGQGMDALLVHLAGRAALAPAGGETGLDTVLWHPSARVVFPGAADDADDEPTHAGAATAV